MTEIRSGDVLLYHGRGFISWAIRKFDGADVNHAAIALDGERMGEAAGRGLQIAPIPASIESNDFMVVRRFDGTDPLDPVVGIADGYLTNGKPYAYQQIVLLAILASTRRIPLPGIGRRMLRSVLDHAAAALNAFVDKGDGTRSMICSEFVYRCNAEAAGDPNPYRLLIRAGDLSFGPGGTAVDWALARPDEELAIDVSPSFDPPVSADPRQAEADLAPLIAAYAEETGLADDDMPTGPLTGGFGPVAAELAAGDVSDAELLGSLGSFGVVLQDATGSAPVAPSFGIGTVIGGAVVKGAIAGIKEISIDPNFVTPGDLLKSGSLADVGRLP